MSAQSELAIRLADEWLESHRVSESWRIMNMLRDELVRASAPAAPQPPEGKKLVVVMNSNVKMSRGKYAAQAIHAALQLLGAHPGVPVVVLGGSKASVSEMPVRIMDAGVTELQPGTLTAGAAWGGERYGNAEAEEA